MGLRVLVLVEEVADRPPDGPNDAEAPPALPHGESAGCGKIVDPERARWPPPAFADRRLSAGGLQTLLTPATADQLIRIGMITYRKGSLLFRTPGESSSISSK